MKNTTVGAFTVLLVSVLLIVMFVKSDPATNNPIQTQASNNIGSESAPIKIVEFADFQCPACAVADPIVKQIINKYSDKVYFSYKHFPLPQHKNAIAAANAAEAMANDNKFFDMASTLYQNQDKWSTSLNSADDLAKLAEDIGGDRETVRNAIKTNLYKDKIESEKKEGESKGIESTPTFFVNDVKYEGALNLEQWNQIIESVLSKPI